MNSVGKNEDPAKSVSKTRPSSPARKPRASKKQEIVPHDTHANDELHEILNGIPAEKRDAFLRIITASESHSGWLPTPAYLRNYENVLPGLAERIVAMPEREQGHRHRVVEKMVDDDNSLKRRGQSFALVSLVLLLGVALTLVYFGQYAWGGRVAIFGIAGVVGIFVTGKWADTQAQKMQKEDDKSVE